VAFGRIYVLEGATLGGRTLLPVVASRVGVTAARGAAFLASYGAAVGEMWSRFGFALDAWCDDQARREAAEAAAIATFESLGRWLCRVPE
jgi:heme oxygenase